MAKMEKVLVDGTRPPRRVSSKDAIQKAEGHIRKWRNLKKYVSGIEELAAGVLLVEAAKSNDPWSEIVIRNTETGEERIIGEGLRIYRSAPSREALQYLVDRALGKSPQRYEITGDEGGPVQVVPWLPTLEPDLIEGEVVDG